MKHIVLAISVLLLFEVGSSIDLNSRLTALRFTKSASSYIAFTPTTDVVSDLKYRATVCSWLKAPTSPLATATAFAYNGNNFRLSGTGNYNQAAGSSFVSYTNPQKHYWHHACLTFSAASKYVRYYVNGKLASSASNGQQISISSSYKVVLGNYAAAHKTMYFGGEMLNLNVYAQELTADEVDVLYHQGMCNFEADSQDHNRILKWEDLLEKTRTGSVTAFTPTNCTGARAVVTQLTERKGQMDKLNETETGLGNCGETLNTTLEKLDAAEEKLKTCNFSTGRQRDWSLFSGSAYINKTVTLAAASKLKSSWQGVAEGMIGLPLTERFIKFLQTIDECSEERPWENLRMEKYYNKVFTKELYQDLTSMWDDVAEKLVGLEMTPKLIDLLNHLQGTPTNN